MAVNAQNAQHQRFQRWAQIRSRVARFATRALPPVAELPRVASARLATMPTLAPQNALHALREALATSFLSTPLDAKCVHRDASPRQRGASSALPGPAPMTTLLNAFLALKALTRTTSTATQSVARVPRASTAAKKTVRLLSRKPHRALTAIRELLQSTLAQ